MQQIFDDFYMFNSKSFKIIMTNIAISEITNVVSTLGDGDLLLVSKASDNTYTSSKLTYATLVNNLKNSLNGFHCPDYANVITLFNNTPNSVSVNLFNNNDWIAASNGYIAIRTLGYTPTTYPTVICDLGINHVNVFSNSQADHSDPEISGGLFTVAKNDIVTFNLTSGHVYICFFPDKIVYN